MAPPPAHYWDHHKVIKAIEKASLEATFGPEITSTRNFLPPKKPRKPDKSKAFFGVTVKAKGESPIDPVKEHTQNKRVHFMLPVEGKSPIDRVTAKGESAINPVKEHAQSDSIHVNAGLLAIEQTRTMVVLLTSPQKLVVNVPF